MTATRRLALLCTTALALSIAACAPDRILIDLAPGDGRLAETSVLRDDGATERSPKVAMIDINGTLASFATGGLIPVGGNPVDDLVARLNKAAQDPEVRAVVLRVNSPGGTVAASETMYEEIRDFRRRSGKPVVVSMAEVAASGGYYISLGADRILAQRSSVTGSIGVVFQTFNVSDGMARWGIASRAVISRPNKDLANPFEPPVEEHYAILQGLVDDFYEQFRGLVAERRPGIETGDMDLVTDGRVFSGERALELGLIDELGNLSDAFKAAKSLAGVERGQLVKYHAEGRRPNSAYAMAPALERGVEPHTGAQINLMQLNLGAEWGASSGFYYLWTPGAGAP